MTSRAHENKFHEQQTNLLTAKSQNFCNWLKYKPAAVITGFDLIASITGRVAGVPLIWLVQSTWDIKQMVRLGLGSYTDDFDLPIFRVLPKSVKIWLSLKMVDVFGRVILKPFNKVAEKYRVRHFDRIDDLWHGNYNLLAEPEDFSGNKEIAEGYHYIGPLIAKIDVPVPEEIKHLPENKPIVYFAMGSFGRPRVMKKIIEGFKEQPFTVIAPVREKIENLNVKVPGNVIVTGWLPALEVSKKADLSVIHGGIGTVMTAALAGKPVVGVGMMYEQESLSSQKTVNLKGDGFKVLCNNDKTKDFDMNPSKHKMSVLNQIFKLIPRNLIPKLACKHGVDKQSRSFSPG